MPTEPSLAEAAVIAVKETFEDHLNDLLEARDLPVIAQIILGEKMLDEIAFTPTIYIFADESEIENWRPRKTGQSGNWDVTHMLSIGVVLENLDTAELRQNLYRYTRAMIETIIDQYPTDGFWLRGRFRMRFSPVLSRQSNFIGDAVITMRFQKVEDRDE